MPDLPAISDNVREPHIHEFRTHGTMPKREKPWWSKIWKSFRKTRTRVSAESLRTYSSPVCFGALALANGVRSYCGSDSSWSFSSLESHGYVGSDIHIDFYVPGVIFGIVFGCLSGVYSRTTLIAIVLGVVAVAGFFSSSCTDQASFFQALTSMSLGGMLPVVYSMVGEWFPGSKGAVGIAFVSSACALGSLLGQILGSISNHNIDWRIQHLLFTIPIFLAALFLAFASKDTQEESKENVVATKWKASVLVLLQGFPGNVPWYILAEQLRDLCIEKLSIKWEEASGVLVTLAGAGLAGLIIGGIIGGFFSKRILYWISIFRAFPIVFIFDFPFLKLDRSESLAVLFLLGAIETITLPGMGALLIEHNSFRTRGLAFALFFLGDDLAKGVARFIRSAVIGQKDGETALLQVCIAIWFISIRSIFQFPREKDPPKKEAVADKPPLPEIEESDLLLINSPRNLLVPSSPPRWSERKRLPTPRLSNSSNDSVSSPLRVQMEQIEDGKTTESSFDSNSKVNSISYSGSSEKLIPSAFSAVRHNQFEALEKLLRDFPSLVDAVDQTNKGNSLLHVACSNGYARIAKLLIRFGANVDLANGDGNSPLHLSYQYGRNSIVSILIAANANENTRNHKDQIPAQMFKQYIFRN